MSEAVRALPGKGIGRRFVILASGDAVARLIAFGVTVYIARVLGPSSYGVIGFATAVMLYLSRVADCGIEYFGLGIREVADDPRRITRLVPGVTLVRLTVASALAVLVAIATLAAPRPDGPVVALYGLTLVTLAASTRWVLLGLERAEVVAISRIAGEAVYALIVLASVRSASEILRVPLAQVTGDIVAVLILAAVVRRAAPRMRMGIEWAVVGPVFRRSWRLVLSALLGLVVYNSDLIMLRFFRDNASVGHYAAAYLFISFLLNMGGVFNQTILPALTRVLPEGQSGSSLYQTSLAQVFAASLPIAVGGAMLSSSLVPMFFGTQYESSITALAVLSLSVPFALMREVATAGLMARNGEKAVLRLTLWAAIGNLLLNIALIPRYGVAGAAAATVITEVLRFLAALLLARDAGFAPVAPLRLWKPLLSASAMAASILVIAEARPVLAIFAGAISYSVAMALVGGLRIRRKHVPRLTV